MTLGDVPVAAAALPATSMSSEYTSRQLDSGVIDFSVGQVRSWRNVVPAPAGNACKERQIASVPQAATAAVASRAPPCVAAEPRHAATATDSRGHTTPAGRQGRRQRCRAAASVSRAQAACACLGGRRPTPQGARGGRDRCQDDPRDTLLGGRVAHYAWSGAHDIKGQLHSHSHAKPARCPMEWTYGASRARARTHTPHQGQGKDNCGHEFPCVPVPFEVILLGRQGTGLPAPSNFAGQAMHGASACLACPWRMLPRQ